MSMGTRRSAVQRGSALLAVLWLTAALAAISLTLATTVRGETERMATAEDGLRAYYLATGAIERGILWIEWGEQYRNPDGSAKYWAAPTPLLRFTYATGEAQVEVIPESARLDVNGAGAAELTSLLMAVGARPDQAQAIAAGIVEWRTPGPASQYALSPTPTFQPRHASFEEIEELLLVRGMTPDLFYGGYGRDAQGRPVARPGLKDCMSVLGATSGFNVNTTPPALLAAIGLPPATVAGIVAIRNRGPIRSMDQLAAFRESGPGFSRLSLTDSTIETLRATARLRRSDGSHSDLERSVSATVRFLGPGYTPRYEVLRWYDNAFQNR
jgi:general secretion pathway protein K